MTRHSKRSLFVADRATLLFTLLFLDVISNDMNEQPIDYSPIDSFHVGRRRKPNFTDHEVLNIVEQYDVHKELLHSREASKSVIAQKQAIWKQITDILNTNYPQVARTVEDVRRKWKKLQSEAKREVAAYRAAQASGSTTSLSSKQMTLYNRILSICRPSALSAPPHFTHASVVAATAALQQHHHHKHALLTKASPDTVFNEQVGTSFVHETRSTLSLSSLPVIRSS